MKIVVINSDHQQSDENFHSHWCFIPEPILIDILKYLPAKTILNVGECCRRWNDISKENYLWKTIFQRDFQVDRKIKLKPGMQFQYFNGKISCVINSSVGTIII